MDLQAIHTRQILCQKWLLLIVLQRSESRHPQMGIYVVVPAWWFIKPFRESSKRLKGLTCPAFKGTTLTLEEPSKGLYRPLGNLECFNIQLTMISFDRSTVRQIVCCAQHPPGAYPEKHGTALIVHLDNPMLVLKNNSKAKSLY